MPGLRAVALRAAPAALASTAVFFVLAPRLVESNLLGCGSGLGDLGCALVGGFLALLLALGASGVAGAVVLAVGRVPKAPLVGLFSALGVASSWLLLRELATTTVGYWVVLASAFFVFNLAFHALFNLSTAPLALTVAYATVALVGGFFAFHLLGREVGSRRYERRQERQVAAVDFEIYEPGRVPPGYRLHEDGLHGTYTDDPEYYEVSYLYGTNQSGDPRPIYVRSFRATPAFDPPKECGYVRPVEWSHPEPCVQVSPGVFLVDRPNLSMRSWYTRFGDTQVVVEGGPSDAAVADVIASLRVRARSGAGR